MNCEFFHFAQIIWLLFTAEIFMHDRKKLLYFCCIQSWGKGTAQSVLRTIIRDALQKLGLYGRVARRHCWNKTRSRPTLFLFFFAKEKENHTSLSFLSLCSFLRWGQIKMKGSFTTLDSFRNNYVIHVTQATAISTFIINSAEGQVQHSEHNSSFPTRSQWIL